MGNPQTQRLLVVDDDPGFAEMIIGAFSHLKHYKISTASNPVEAVNAMKRQHFQVVLLDYGLPTINGDDLMGVLQNINPQACFIVVSGLGEAEIENKFRGHGYFCFFEKGSLQVQRLREEVQRAFSSRL